MTDLESDPPTGDLEHHERRKKAAAALQGHWRGWKQQREDRGLNIAKSEGNKTKSNAQDDKDEETKPAQHHLSSSERWSNAMTSQKLEQTSADQLDGKNDPKTRWQRMGFYAERLTEGPAAGGNDPDEKGEPKNEHEAQLIKQMEAQYWLEMIDKKHRYGANLKSYHQRWNQEDTTEPFFYWLDQGGGKDLDLDSCPRERLEKEQITYLSPEQRKNYLVKVVDGKLIWARNGKPVDTKKGRWKDGGHGRGVVERGGPEDQGVRSSQRPVIVKLNRNKDEPTGQNGTDDDDSSTSSAGSAYSSGSSQKGDKKTQHYSGKDEGTSSRRYYTSPKAVFDVLLRKTTKGNTWIFVMAAGSKELYVGIKQMGGFQHSSFLYGAKVASAGLLKAKEGTLSSLSPLSGHYRAGTEHFKNFVAELEREGVDMSHVSTSKSLAMIGAIEKYAKVQKKKKDLSQDLKHKLGITSKQDKEQAQAEADEERITSEAKEKEEDYRLKADSTPGKTDQKRAPLQEERLPYDGKGPSELNEKQRYERGLALMRKAMAGGLPEKEGKAATEDSAKAAQIERDIQSKQGET